MFSCPPHMFCYYTSIQYSASLGLVENFYIWGKFEQHSWKYTNKIKFCRSQ